MINLEGKIALVAGSSKGIGKAIAIEMTKLGAISVITGRTAKSLRETAKEIRGIGGECHEIVVDFIDEMQIKNMASEILSRYGKIDILVNNVGGSAPPIPLDELTNEMWEDQLSSNLTSVFYSTRAIVEGMKRRKWGRIINIASAAGRSYSQLGGVPYAAAKHAVVGFTRQLAKELAPYAITVNCVAPGIIGTERILKRWQTRKKQQQNEILSKILLGRLGRPEEVAAVVAFLASDASSYITGATIDVNGGQLMI
jgi:3-oxoacyl-[acyl-carrier protein] reductase